MQNDALIKMRDQLEYLFLRVIIPGMKNNTIPIPQAKQLTREFLSIEPFTSSEDARQKIDKFTSAHQGFSLLKEYADVYYHEDKIDDKLEVMRQHLKQNNIDEALNVIQT